MSDKENRVFIVLAALNGAEFLSAQLGTLLSQNFTHWTLLIRDDNSSDGTLEIIRGYAENHKNIQLFAELAAESVPRAVAACSASRRTHFVTHSMGGILFH